MGMLLPFAPLSLQLRRAGSWRAAVQYFLTGSNAPSLKASLESNLLSFSVE